MDDADIRPTRDSLVVRIRRVENAKDLPLPAYQSDGAVAVDLYASVTNEINLEPSSRARIACGIEVALPDGYEAQVRPRSGLAAKHGITVLNSPGTVDADYRGELYVILVNHGDAAFRIERGMRIAQLLIFPVPKITWLEVDDLPPTNRMKGGFGHTGA